MRRPDLSIVVRTYEWPEALDVVLYALSEESDDDFEVVVADDGSGPRTAEVVSSWQARLPGRVAHVRQPDEGFRLARVGNLGALKARGKVLAFLDGDAVPRRGFVAAVRKAALPGWFLATKRLNLSEQLSREVLGGSAPVWRWSAARWLATRPRELVASPHPVEVNRPGVLLPIRDRRRPWRNERDFLPPYEAYGCFTAVQRSDFDRVNGFDLRYEGWGEEDADLVVRLRRAGLRCGWPGPAATLLHLWHPHRKDASSRNLPLLRQTEESGRVEAAPGLRELERSAAGT